MNTRFKRMMNLSGRLIGYIVISCASLLFVLFMLITIQRKTTSIYSHQIKNIESLSGYIREFSSNVTGIQLVVQQLLRQKDIDSLEVFAERFTTRIKTVHDASVNTGDAHTKLDAQVDSLLNVDQHVVDLFMQNDAARANLVFINQSNPQYENVLDEIERYRASLYSEFETTAKQELRRNNHLRGLAFIIAAVCIIFCIITGVMLLRSVVIPLKQLIAMLSDIVNGNGDLTKRLSISSGDELGEMASLFNRFIEQQQNIFSQLSRTTISLNSASGALRTIADTFSGRSKDIATQSSVVNQSAIDTVSGFSNISDATNNMSHSINTIASAIEEISASLNEVSRNCQHELSIASEAHKQAERNNNVMNKLKESIKQIDTILDSINDIAEQTNMLALNATIEAASAGDAGKGFAVVAGEVKTLSNLTAQSTEHIAAQIDTIHTDIRNSIEASGKVLEIIEEVTSISNTIAVSVEEQSATISETAKNISNAGDASKDIVISFNEGTGHLDEISSAIQKIDTAFNDNAEQMNQVQSNAMHLAELSTDLDTIVRKFKIQ